MCTFISKYKPYNIDDFCSDTTFISTIYTLLKIDQLNLLFIGDNSSGKTTLLNILIREYYNLNTPTGMQKTTQKIENNILYVNNLKEQGIQYFRNEMKTFCQSHSSIYGKKKLVIIDDIDNINEQSQHVFRNYIDKYKHNIHFISVCSNLHKVTESIQSRLHILKIPLLTPLYIETKMNNIINKENISVDEDSKQYLLQITNSSIRPLINYLEKMFIYNKPITLDVCKKVCSNISFIQFENYFKLIQQNDLQGAVEIIYNIYDYGYSVLDILDYLFFFIKTTDIVNDTTKYKIIQLLCKYITLFNNIHEDCIELALFTNNLYSIMHN